VLQNLVENAWKFTAKREHATVEFGTTTAAGDTSSPRAATAETSRAVMPGVSAPRRGTGQHPGLLYK
jgi:hypothetical protein